jgi:hypothetical protein
LIVNGYCTLADLKVFMPNSTNLDTTSAEQAINAASRAFDKIPGLSFFPSVYANKYNTPRGRELKFYDELLEVISLINGDGVAITDYDLWPFNTYPKYSALLRPLSSVYFNQSTTTWNQAAVMGTAIWGHHEDYGRAWATGANLGTAVTDTTGTSWAFAVSSPFVAGNIGRCGNELIRFLSVSSSSAVDTWKVDRGYNGSTAATHLIAAPVIIWRPMAQVVQAIKIQAARYYRRGEAVFGTTGGGEMGVQPVALAKLDPDVQQIAESFYSRF